MTDRTQSFDQFLTQMDLTHDPPTTSDYRTIEAHYTATSSENLLNVLSKREHSDAKSTRMVCDVIRKLLQERDDYESRTVAVTNSQCVML